MRILSKKVLESILIFFLIPALGYSADFLSYEDSAPDVELSVRKVLSGPVTASILATLETEDINLFERSEIYLKIEDANESWWVHTPTRFDSMDIVQFVNNSYLLVTLSSSASISTAVLDLEDRSLNLIGSGAGEIVSSNPEDPLVRLNGQRGYSDGVFWYRSITDLQGRVIEFLTSSESCLPISEIVSSETDLSRLQQPMDFCVGISK